MADEYSRKTLIPQVLFEEFVSKNHIVNRDSILQFSKSIGVAPGIVVGRLQNDKYIKYSQFNEFKDKYEIV